MEKEEVKIWQTKHYVDKLSKLRGVGTSVITLILPPGEQLTKVGDLLTKELSSATNIKSRVNRLSVLNAVTSAQNKLKLYKKLPDNGLVILCGNVEIDGKEKRLSISFEPAKPVCKFVYMCDSKFHLQSVADAISIKSNKIGFIIIDGKGLFVSTLNNNLQEVLYKYQVSLPGKTVRGGQSKSRFERLVEEAHHVYMIKCLEAITRLFLVDGTNVTVKGIIIAGCGSKRIKFQEMLPQPLKDVVIQNIAVSIGFQQGMNEAVSLCTDQLKEVGYVKQRKMLSLYFEYIAKGVNKICYGIKDTLYALEQGLVETLLICENHAETPFKKSEEGDEISLLEHLIEQGEKTDTKICLISQCTPEGSQFLGISGIGGILRYETNIIDQQNIDGDVNVDVDNNNDQNLEKDELSDEEDLW